MIKSDYEVRIRKANNGIIVDIGCKTLVFGEQQVVGSFLPKLETFLLGSRAEIETIHKAFFPEDFEEKLNAVRRAETVGLQPRVTECCDEAAPQAAGY